MPTSDPQPPDPRDTAWLLHSAMAWALSGAVMTIARRPLWHGVGVVLLVLGFGVVGWIVRRLLRQQPPPRWTDAEGTGRTGSPRRERRLSRHSSVWAGRAGSGGRHRPAA
jgi:hypothetical protein